jgi:hypothetical protein
LKKDTTNKINNNKFISTTSMNKQTNNTKACDKVLNVPQYIHVIHRSNGLISVCIMFYNILFAITSIQNAFGKG